jgi:cob(I)alamin adenosyltransferase
MAKKVYTKTGDRGTTSLLGGTRVPKDHWRMEATGNLDELSSAIGVIPSCAYDDKLKHIQTTLFNMMSVIGTDGEKFDVNLLKDVTEEDTLTIESWIDEMDKELPELKNFILPYGHVHLARSVCRRVERRMVGFKPEYVKYLNRLSDYLFVYARYVSYTEWRSSNPNASIEHYQESKVSQLQK